MLALLPLSASLSPIYPRRNGHGRTFPPVTAMRWLPKVRPVSSKPAGHRARCRPLSDTTNGKAAAGRWHRGQNQFKCAGRALSVLSCPRATPAIGGLRCAKRPLASPDPRSRRPGAVVLYVRDDLWPEIETRAVAAALGFRYAISNSSSNRSATHTKLESMVPLRFGFVVQDGPLSGIV